MTYCCVDRDAFGSLKPQPKEFWRILCRDVGPIEWTFDEHLTPVVADVGQAEQRVPVVTDI